MAGLTVAAPAPSRTTWPAQVCGGTTAGVGANQPANQPAVTTVMAITATMASATLGLVRAPWAIRIASWMSSVGPLGGGDGELLMDTR